MYMFIYTYIHYLVVGAICSRIEAHSIQGYTRLYIMTISILSAYRRRGIGNFKYINEIFHNISYKDIDIFMTASKLLKHVLDIAAKDPKNVDVYLHVQTRCVLKIINII